MIGKVVRPYCSVFYIPLFPEGQGEPFMECTNCGGKFHGDVQDIRHRLANRGAELNAEIEKKRQSFEADPSDVETGCEIVELLVAADRENEGLQLAEQLAQTHADNANVHVMLARVCMHQNEMERMFHAFQRAIAINPTHAGAHYYSAVAMLNVDPPKLDEALSVAKQARDYGHPDARELIEAIEQAKVSGS